MAEDLGYAPTASEAPRSKTNHHAFSSVRIVNQTCVNIPPNMCWVISVSREQRLKSGQYCFVLFVSLHTYPEPKHMVTELGDQSQPGTIKFLQKCRRGRNKSAYGLSMSRFFITVVCRETYRYTMRVVFLMFYK